MSVALWLLAIQGVIGAFDTLYYHEWRARLPARGAQSAPELKLHAARDFFYAVLFGTLPWLAWHGVWALVLAGVLVAEIVLTLTDFVVEITARKVLGPIGMVWLIWRGTWPASAVVLCVTNDFIWWIPFGVYLHDAWPAFRGDARF